MRWWKYILPAACGLFLLLFLLVPVALSIQAGFKDDGRWTLFWLKQAMGDVWVSYSAPWWQHVVRVLGQIARMLWSNDPLPNALRVALATTAGVFLLGVPLAVLGDQVQFRGKSLATGLLMAPMILPPFVGAIAMRKLMAQHAGPFNLLLGHLGLPAVDWLGSGFWGVVVLEVLHLYPILFLNASAALANVDPTMVEAARNLGAGRWRAFRKVTLPLIMPGLFAGGTIVFIWSFTELGTPLMLGYEHVLPVKIFQGFNTLETPAKTFSQVFIMLSASVGLYAVGKMLFGRSAAATAGRGVAATQRRVGWAGSLLCWAAFGGVTLVAMLPHTGVLLMAFAGRWGMTILPESYTLDNFARVFQDADTWNSIVNSLQYASAATAIDIVLGLAVAYAVVRQKPPGAEALDWLAMLPLAVPGLVIASGYVALTTAPPPIPVLRELLGSMSPRENPALILVIAYSVRRLPYMVRSISAGLQQTSVTLEEAARNLGASPLRTVWRITVPLISANVLAGAILSFSFAMLEVSDSLILAQTREFYPITKQIYELRELGNMQFVAAALGALCMLLLIGTLLAANLLLKRRMGALFRV